MPPRAGHAESATAILISWLAWAVLMVAALAGARGFFLVSLGAVLVVALLAPALTRWRRSRRRAHSCPSCGYSLAGLRAACPECGWGHKGHNIL